MNGIIALYKQRGMTSFDCISKLRKILHTKRIGHTGTLDPNVDGVLPVCVGSATKISELLMQSGKVYRGTITIGEAYDTQDLEGKRTAKVILKDPVDDRAINASLAKFTGKIMQMPPMYSAVKVNGKRLYEYARQGITIKRKARPIEVKYFKQIKPSTFNKEEGTQEVYFEVACSKGTYVRTLAFDFGKSLGYPSVMTDLTRVQSGGFSISQTKTLAEIQELFEQGKTQQFLEPLSEALKKYPIVSLTKDQWQIVLNGGFFDPRELATSEKLIQLQYQGQTRALYQLDNRYNKYRPFKMFLN